MKNCHKKSRNNNSKIQKHQKCQHIISNKGSISFRSDYINKPSEQTSSISDQDFSDKLLSQTLLEKHIE